MTLSPASKQRVIRMTVEEDKAIEAYLKTLPNGEWSTYVRTLISEDMAANGAAFPNNMTRPGRKWRKEGIDS